MIFLIVRYRHKTLLLQHIKILNSAFFIIFYNTIVTTLNFTTSSR